MKNVLFGFLVICLMFLSACNQDELVTPIRFQENSGNIDIAENVMLDLNMSNVDAASRGTSCFQLIYPLTYILPDGSEITGKDEMSLGLALREWMAANPMAGQRPALKFPVQVAFNGEELTVETMEGLLRIRNACVAQQEEANPAPCFTFAYPLTFIAPDGSEISGEDEESFGIALREWYAANPDVSEQLVPKYPFTVMIGEREMVIENEEAYLQLRLSCNENQEESEAQGACFTFVYPLSYVLPDGSEITGDDETSLGLAIRAWYADNPDVTQRPVILYPFTVVVGEEEIVIENEEMFTRLRESCQQDEAAEDGGPCLELQYPLTYNLPDSTTVTGNDAGEVGKALRAWYAANPDIQTQPVLQFPIEVLFRGQAFQVVDQMVLDRMRASCERSPR